jgi:phosphatidate phosphatase APP1
MAQPPDHTEPNPLSPAAPGDQAAHRAEPSRLRHVAARLGLRIPLQIAAYRGHGDARGVELCGRVLARPGMDGAHDDAHWWHNLRDTYRRFASRKVPHARLRVTFQGASAEPVCDREGYYHAELLPQSALTPQLWADAAVCLADGRLLTPQPVLQVAADAAFGVISDIDDTILHTGIASLRTTAQLTFLHNARTRKPLCGVAALYRALQSGASGAAGHQRHPVFYVSSSPWNLYDLLDDFIDHNDIPCGPIFLRDFGIERGKFIATRGHGHKLDHAIALIERYPHLRWVLAGDSGQDDAELYAEAAQAYPERIAAIYIRDVDPDHDSPLDQAVDAHIERVAGTSVPMLRAPDSLAMAEHAQGLGLIDGSAVALVAADVRRDNARPEVGEAMVDAALGRDDEDPAGPG